MSPFSTYFGFDRGTPIDRYYLHDFLDANRAVITGDVLEIQSPGYTRLYGHDLRRTDSVDVVGTGKPTYVCDLAKSEGLIPDSSYDCFLLPNTLSVLQDIEGCMRNALRVVRPHGTILAAAAAFVPICQDCADYWRLSVDGWNEVLKRAMPGSELNVTGKGNCLAACASLMGLASEELGNAELDHHDPAYPVAILIRVRKQG